MRDFADGRRKSRTLSSSHWHSRFSSHMSPSSLMMGGARMSVELDDAKGQLRIGEDSYSLVSTPSGVSTRCSPEPRSSFPSCRGSARSTVSGPKGEYERDLCRSRALPLRQLGQFVARSTGAEPLDRAHAWLQFGVMLALRYQAAALRVSPAGADLSASARCLRPSNMRRVMTNPAGSIADVSSQAQTVRACTRLRDTRSVRFSSTG